MDRYEVLKFVHVAAAAIWIGGVAMMQAFATRAQARGDLGQMIGVAGDIAALGKRLVMPMALTVIVVGFLLIWDGPWTLGMEWVWISLILFGISFLAGVGYFEPEGKRIAAQLESEGATPATLARIKKNLVLSRLDLLLLLAIVFLMVTKPGV